MTSAVVRLALCLGACLATACAGPGPFDPPPQGSGSVRSPTGEPLSPQAAMDMITIGKSTQADVFAALGEAIAITFHSGYDVWVYRWAGSEPTTRAATELVVLFAPSGVATKVRVRPGYATRE